VHISDRLAEYRLGVLGQRATDFLAVRRIAPIECFLTCEGGEDAGSIAGISPLLSPEHQDCHRRVWTNRSLGELVGLARDQLGDIIRNPQFPLNVLAYSATAEWELFAVEKGIFVNVVAPDAKLKTALDDKILVRGALSRLGLPVPTSLAVNIARLDYEALVVQLGQPLIVQRPFGSAGIGTFVVDSAEELKSAGEAQKGSLLVSSYEGATTLNVHGLVTQNGTGVSMPSVQLTGIPELSSSWSSYCGNDYSAIKDLPPEVLLEVQRLTAAVGEWLFGQEYRGIFGIDMVIQDSTVRILEVNPRLQGSTWLLSEFELESGKIPMAINHFLQLLGQPVDLDSQSYACNGAYAILHHLGPQPAEVAHDLRPGVFMLNEQGQLAWKREGFGFIELQDEEFLVFGIPPRPMCIVDPGAVLARIATRSRLATSNGRALTEWAARVVKAVAREFSTI
jgi:predicted ATP-grasp superfamily ATP-dependent carboligase